MWMKIQGTMYNTDHFVQMWEEKQPSPALGEQWTPTLTHVITACGEELVFYQPGIIEEVCKHDR